jgi:hypothetical protein
MSAYKHYAVALYVVGAVALGGCSALGRVTALHSEPDKEGWVARPPIPERSHPAFMRYEFAHGTGTVITCSLQTRMSIVGFGPPLIPIVPGALFPFTSFDPSTEHNVDDLFFYLQVNSPAASTGIDLSKIALRANGSGEPARLKSVRRYGDNERWPDVCGRHLLDQGEIVSGQQVVSNRDVQYLLVFDFPWKTTETFSIDLGSIAVAERQIPVPAMTYRRDSYYFYVPLLIPPGGHGQKPWILYGGAN